MKKHTLVSIAGAWLLLIACMFATGSSTAHTAKHPPGTSVLHSNYNPVCVQGGSDLQGGFVFQMAVLLDPQWEPRLQWASIIEQRAAKALPKSARQRLYGLSDHVQLNQRLC